MGHFNKRITQSIFFGISSMYILLMVAYKILNEYGDSSQKLHRSFAILDFR